MTETTGRMGAGGGERLLSLDAFRGLTIAGMILVNKRIGIIGAWRPQPAPASS